MRAHGPPSETRPGGQGTFLSAQGLVTAKEEGRLGVFELFLFFFLFPTLGWNGLTFLDVLPPVSSFYTRCPVFCPLFLARLRIGDI